MANISQWCRIWLNGNRESTKQWIQFQCICPNEDFDVTYGLDFHKASYEKPRNEKEGVILVNLSKHTTYIKDQCLVQLNINAVLRGPRGDNSWSALVNSQYLIDGTKAKSYLDPI